MQYNRYSQLQPATESCVVLLTCHMTMSTPDLPARGANVPSYSLMTEAQRCNQFA